MSERYQRLFSLEKNLYSEGAPVLVLAGAILKDTTSNKILAQLKFRNISFKPIKALKVKLDLLDTAGHNLESFTEFQYLDLYVSRNGEFGEQTPIPLSDSYARSMRIFVIEVVFSDGTVWEEEKDWEALSVLDANTSIIDEFKMIFGGKAKCIPNEVQDLWFCTCGVINRREEEICHECSLKKEDLFAYCDADVRKQEVERLKEIKRVLDEKAREEVLKKEEQRRLKDEENARKKEEERAKRKKRRFRICVWICLIAVTLLGVNGVLYYLSPESMYCYDGGSIFGITSERAIVNGVLTLPEELAGQMVETIGENAFLGNENIIKILMPTSIKRISQSAFSECTNLNVIVYDGTVEQWNSIRKEKSWDAYVGEYTVVHTGQCLFGEWVEEGRVICDEGGIEKRTCICDSEETRKIEPKEHQVVRIEGKEVTCTENGYTASMYCSVCNEVLVQQEEILATGHVIVKDERKEPTCILSGLSEGTHCDVCNEEIEKQEYISPTGHTYGEWEITKNATCVAKGTETQICAICGNKNERDIKAKGHKYGEWSVTKATTCVKMGIETRICSSCKDEDQREIPLEEHSYVNKKCKVCGKNEPSKGLEYRLNSDGKSYAVESIGTCTDTFIVIPDEYKGKPIISIWYGAFENCEWITDIEFPSSLKEICSSAFENCTSLDGLHINDVAAWCSVEMPSTLGHPLFDARGKGIIYINGKKVSSITIPGKVKVINDDVFYDCSNIVNLVIEEGVEEIGAFAFEECNIKKVTLPSSLKEIGMYAFQDNINLESITIPNGVRKIYYSTFDGCDNLDVIYFQGTRGQWAKIAESYIYGRVITVVCTDGKTEFEVPSY